MTAILVLSIVGVIVNWIMAFWLNFKFNIFLHAIFIVVVWPYSTALGIIGIVFGALALILNIAILSNE